MSKLKNELDPQARKKVYARRPNGSKIIEKIFDPKNDPNDVSLTDQSFAEECDVNLIMERFTKTGQLPTNMREPGQFLDLTQMGDYQDSLNLVSKARESFESLPAKVRARFGNDPAELVKFFDDEANFDEAIKLGLIEKPETPKEPEPTRVIITNPEPTKTPAS